MNKTIAGLLVIWGIFSSAAADTIKKGIIGNIGIIKEKTLEGNKIFSRIVLGIKAEEHCYYRLVFKEEIVAGGRINRGLNLLEIKNLKISKEEILRYFLELKQGKSIIKKAIDLNIACTEINDRGNITDSVEKRGFGLGMFIDNQLILYQRRALNICVTPKEMAVKNSKVIIPRDKIDKMTAPDFMTNSFSILSTALLGAKLLFDKIKKDQKAKAKKILKLTRILEGEFLKKGPDGKEIPVYIKLVLSYK